jgi:hypothetical protein
MKLLSAGCLSLLAVLQPAPAPLQRLQASIETTTRSINATWGIYVKSLETGEEITINADRQMETMSTIKIPLMIEVLEQVKAGTFKLGDKYTFVEADSQPGTGTIQRLDPGAVMTVKDLLTLMIIVSDNTATEVLYRMVGGPAAVNARMAKLGLKDTRAMNVPSKWFPQLRAAASPEQFYRDKKFPFGFSTPREMGRLLEMMERGTLVDSKHAVHGPATVSRTRLATFLPQVVDDVGVLEVDGRHVGNLFTNDHDPVRCSRTRLTGLAVVSLRLPVVMLQPRLRIWTRCRFPHHPHSRSDARSPILTG